MVRADRDRYIKKLNYFVSVQRTFQKKTVNDNDFLNFVINQKKRIVKFIKSLLTPTACPKKHEDI